LFVFHRFFKDTEDQAAICKKKYKTKVLSTYFSRYYFI